MATVSITLNGVMYPKGRSANDQPIPATFVGEAWLTDLGVGGGPILPGGGGGSPPGIWGPTDPRPTPPIYIPKPPTEPPPGGGDKPPPEESGGWGFVAEWSRWGYFPGPTEAGPKV